MWPLYLYETQVADRTATERLPRPRSALPRTVAGGWSGPSTRGRCPSIRRGRTAGTVEGAEWERGWAAGSCDAGQAPSPPPDGRGGGVDAASGCRERSARVNNGAPATSRLVDQGGGVRISFEHHRNRGVTGDPEGDRGAPRPSAKKCKKPFATDESVTIRRCIPCIGRLLILAVCSRGSPPAGVVDTAPRVEAATPR